MMEMITSPKTPHSPKCVVVAVTNLALTSMEEPPSGAVQTPASFLYMKCSDASLTPAWEKAENKSARRRDKRRKKRTQPDSAWHYSL